MTSRALLRVEKEFNEFKQNMPSIVQSLEKIDDLSWIVTLKGPESSPYQGGFFKILVEFSNAYPFNPPNFRIISKILHLNISQRGTICECCWEIRSEWSPTYTVIKKIFIIHDVLESYKYDCGLDVDRFGNFREDKMKFYNMIREYTLKYEEQDDYNRI